MEKRIQAQEELRAEEKADAVQNMRFYKFYPVATPDAPDISSVKVVSLFLLFGFSYFICSREYEVLCVFFLFFLLADSIYKQVLCQRTSGVLRQLELLNILNISC